MIREEKIGSIAGGKAALERQKKKEIFEKLEKLADRYKSFVERGDSIIDWEGLQKLLVKLCDRLAEGTSEISLYTINAKKFYQKTGAVYNYPEQFIFPDAKKGDRVHSTTWNNVMEMCNKGILKATQTDYGEGIWYRKKLGDGSIKRELSYGWGKAHGQEDFPVAIRISQEIIDFLRVREQESDTVMIIDGRAGNISSDGYISADINQGIPLLLLEFGLPDGKWHSFVDVAEVIEKLKKIKVAGELYVNKLKKEGK